MNDTHRETEKGRRNPDRLAAYKDGGEWKLLKLVFSAQSTMTAINRAKDVGKVEKVGGGGRGDGGGGGGNKAHINTAYKNTGRDNAATTGFQAR